MLSMVTHYLQCLANLQTVSTHVAQKLPALLKLFHTKAYQQARFRPLWPPFCREEPTRVRDGACVVRS